MVIIPHQGILNTKIINYKAKGGVSVIMDPHARCVLYGMIPKWSHMFQQLLVSDDPILFDPIHALFDANADPPLVFYQCIEVVRINDFPWDDFQWNAHKLWV